MLIVQTTFTGRGQVRPEWRDCQERWIRDRIEIFKEYTLASLFNQTDKDFLHWISFRPEDESNKDIKELREYLKGYNFIFTFNGQPYWDDKGYNKDLKERLEKDLSLIDIKEPVYFSVLDSDDCWHRDMVKTIKGIKSTEAIVVKNGYCLMEDGLYEWKPQTNPPFYTIIFSNFKDIDKIIERWSSFKSHEDIPKIFKTELLPDGLYLVLMHKLNRSTKNPKGGIHPYIGREVDKKILTNFGII